MKTYEIYCQHFSRIIQADSFERAMYKFKRENPCEQIICIEDVDFREALNSMPEEKEDTIDPREIWDEYSENINDDIYSLQEVAGTNIITHRQFKYLCEIYSFNKIQTQNDNG